MASAAPVAARIPVPRRATGRIGLAIAAGALGGWGFSVHHPMALAVVAGWDLGGLVMLALAWLTIVRCDPALTQERAGSEDPGRTAVYVLVTVTSGVSLFAATILSRRARVIAAEDPAVLVGLCLLAVALAWALTHTSFTMRYAHLYYREDAEGVGGVELPGGGRPSYADFAYFAFTVGMCFQVSDCTVSSPQIRRAVLMHAVLSFVYNTVILALTLNLVFGAAG
jgi:uncharacterized membrane protein